MKFSSQRTRHDVIEHAALGASLLCLVHCLALPFIFAAMPALGSVLPIGPAFHLAMLGVAVPASATALLSGRSHYHARWPLVAGFMGLLLLATGVLGFGETSLETPLTVVGATLLAAAHVGNLGLRRRTRPWP